MKQFLTITASLAMLGLAGCGSGTEETAATTTEEPAPAASTVLLDGTSTEGWNRVGGANWEVADGAVEGSGETGYLVSPQSYGDFKLTVEFWVDEPANSGVFIRCQDPAMIDSNTCYEVNIFDTRPDQSGRTGAIVDVAPPLATVNAANQWNTYVITAQGTHLMVELNGTKTVDVEHEGHLLGPIALQYGSGVVKFRRVEIQPL